MRVERNPRNVEIYEAREKGDTYAAIAKAHGISRKRVEQIWATIKHRKELEVEARERIKRRGVNFYVAGGSARIDWASSDVWTPERQWREESNQNPLT